MSKHLTSTPAHHEQIRELLEQTNRELRGVEGEISSLLMRKRLLLVLRNFLVGLPPGASVPLPEDEGSESPEGVPA